MYDWERDRIVNTIEKSDEQDKDKDMTGHPKSNEPVLIEHFNVTGAPGASCFESASAGASESASASAGAGAVASASAAAVADVAATAAKRAQEWTREQVILFGKGNGRAFPDRPTGA